MTQFDSKLISQAKKTKGYLQKKSTSPFSTWKKKYCIFLEDSFCIFKDQTLQSLQKSLNFSDIIHVNLSETLLIQIKTIKKTYFLKAQTSADQDLWIASINILKENYFQQAKSPNKALSSSHSIQKQLTESFKSIQTTEKSKASKSSRRQLSSEKITYLLRGKQLSKFLNLLHLEKLSAVTKQEKFLSRILFVQDKNNGIFFSLSSKSIYPLIDGQLIKEDLIYPYQLNVLYFLPMITYKNALENKNKSIKLIEICKCSQILQSTVISSSIIRLQIHCQKPVEIQVKHLSEIFVGNLQDCIKRLVQIGKEYWNPKGKLQKNIDEFIYKYQQNDQNQLVFYKMVENEFQNALNISIKAGSQKKQIEVYFNKIDSLTLNLKNFIEACQIKSEPLDSIKEKFVKLYHKFVYNFLNQNWNFVYKIACDQELIIYSKKVYSYFMAFNPIHNDSRVKEGCRTLLKIALRNFHNTVNQLINSFTDIQEESLRILKKVDFQKEKETVTDFIFFSTYCTNFFSILTLQFRSLSQMPKNDEFVKMSWLSMHQITKSAFEKLSLIAQHCRQRSSLISISNSLKHLKNRRIPELYQELQKTLLFSYKKEKDNFLKEICYEISLVETFCVKKLFVITFSSIDKHLLKLDIKNMDFFKICNIVIQEISKLNHILPEVRTAMYDAAFQQVCYFLYICIVKFDNKLLSKDECLSMINQKMTSIKDSFITRVDQQKIVNLLKDLNLLKQFITCPINSIKNITKELKRVFGSNFTELNLKNLISLRVNSLKEKQYLFEECREQIKSSYNSTDEIQSFQRESYFNSSYRRQRVSTLTESLKSYCQQFQKVDYKSKKERTILFGLQDSINEGCMYRKKIIKNFNTSYNKFFYRLKKGKLFEYDNDRSQDILNCYLLGQLRKCYIEPQKDQCIHLEFDKQAINLKAFNQEQASHWIQKILEAMEEQKSLLGDFNEQVQDADGVLFEDLSKKITFQTKETNEASSPKQKLKIKYKHNASSDMKGNRTSPKKNNTISPNLIKKVASPSKPRNQHQVSKQKAKHEDHSKKKNKKQKGGCGAGCNLF